MSWISEQDRIDRDDYLPSGGYVSPNIEVRFFRNDGSFFDKSVPKGTQEEYARQNGLRAGMASWNYGPQRVYG